MRSLLTTEQTVKAYERTSQLSCPEGPCPKCHEEPGWFARKELKDRWVYILVLPQNSTDPASIKRILTFLMRWKCPMCRRTFYVYPEFILPCKRYARDALAFIAANQLSQQCEYRQGVHVHNQPVAYQASDDPDEIDERRLVHSTLWAWVGFLGGMTGLLRHMCGRIRERDPRSEVHRFVPTVNPSRYATKERRQLLERATQQVLWVAQAYRRLFGGPVLPVFPTFQNVGS
jgi:hypothetical protein